MRKPDNETQEETERGIEAMQVVIDLRIRIAELEADPRMESHAGCMARIVELEVSLEAVNIELSRVSAERDVAYEAAGEPIRP